MTAITMRTKTFCILIILLITSLVINIGTVITIIYHFDKEEKNSETTMLNNGEDNSIFQGVLSELGE